LKINIPVDHHIHRKLKEAGVEHDTRVSHVSVDADSYAHFLKRIATDYTHISSEEQHALAVSTCLTHPNHRHKQKPVRIPIQKIKTWPWYHWLIIVIALLLALCFTTLARCQGTSQIDVITFKNAANTTVKSFAAPFTIKEGTGVTFGAVGSVLTLNATGGGTGTVTSVSCGGLSPLFSCSVGTATTTPSIAYTLSNAAAHTFFGNNTAGLAAPGFQSIGLGDLPGSGALTINTTAPLGGGGSVALGSSLTFTCTTCLTSVTAHNLLSATHGDTTAGTVARGDVITGQGASPTWTRLAKGAATRVLKMDGSAVDVLWGQVDYSEVSSLPQLAQSKFAVAHNFLTEYNASNGLFQFAQPAYTDISGTPAVPTGTGFSHVTGGALDVAAKLINLTAATDVAANQGTATTVFHGNAAGQGSFGAVAQGDVTGGYVDLTNAQNPIAGNKTFSGNVSALSYQFVRRMVEQEAGADLGAKLSNCVVNITSGSNGAFGGICDATNVQGFQSAAATVTINHDLVQILLPCNLTWTLSGSPAIAWTSSGSSMVGCSYQSTQLITNSATADILSIGGASSKNVFSDFNIQSSVVRSAGSGMKVSGGDNNFSRIWIFPVWNGISLDTASTAGGNTFNGIRWSGGGSGAAWNCMVKHGGVATGNVASNSFHQSYMFSNGGTVADAMWCVQDGSDSLEITGGQAVANIGGNDAVSMHFERVAAGNAPSNIRVENFTMEGGATKAAVVVDSAFGVEFTGSTAQSSLQGLVANSGTRISWKGGLFFNNQQEGVRDNNVAVTDLQVLGARFCNNSLATNNTFSDFFAVAATTGFFLQSNRFLACQAGGNAPKNNVEIAAGASTNYQVTGNGLSSSVGAAILDGGTGTDKVICGNTPDTTGVNSFCNVRKVYLTGNYTNATTTFSNVASGNTLQFAVGASKDYHIQCDILYSGSATTAGLKIQFTGPASPTAVWYSLNAFTAATTYNTANTIVGFSNSIGTATTPTTALFPAVINFWLRNGANAGTVVLQAASVGTGTLTINNASGCTIQ
jgi:hypothetical protein